MGPRRKRYHEGLRLLDLAVSLEPVLEAAVGHAVQELSEEATDALATMARAEFAQKVRSVAKNLTENRALSKRLRVHFRNH
jgi:hypothetical protein